MQMHLKFLVSSFFFSFLALLIFFFFFHLDYMHVNFTIPTTSMCRMTHQIATITTAGEAVGA